MVKRKVPLADDGQQNQSNKKINNNGTPSGKTNHAQGSSTSGPLMPSTVYQHYLSKIPFSFDPSVNKITAFPFVKIYHDESKNILFLALHSKNTFAPIKERFGVDDLNQLDLKKCEYDDPFSYSQFKNSDPRSIPNFDRYIVSELELISSFFKKGLESIPKHPGVFLVIHCKETIVKYHHVLAFGSMDEVYDIPWLKSFYAKPKVVRRRSFSDLRHTFPLPGEHFYSDMEEAADDLDDDASAADLFAIEMESAKPTYTIFDKKYLKFTNGFLSEYSGKLKCRKISLERATTLVDTLTKIDESVILAACFVDKVKIDEKEVHSALDLIYETPGFCDLFKHRNFVHKEYVNISSYRRQANADLFKELFFIVNNLDALKDINSPENGSISSVMLFSKKWASFKRHLMTSDEAALKQCKKNKIALKSQNRVPNALDDDGVICIAGSTNPRINTPSDRVANANIPSVTPILNFPLVFGRRLEELEKRISKSENLTEKRIANYLENISTSYAKSSIAIEDIENKLVKLQRKYKKLKKSKIDVQKRLEAMEKTHYYVNANYVHKKSLSGSSTKSSES